MKKYLFILLAFCSFISAKAQNTLYVTITNIQNTSGNMAVAVFNSKGSFLKDDQQFKGKFIELKKGDQITIPIEDLPDGTYAVSVFHDENGNSELDKNALGIPKEAYGFSNDAKGTLGPPSYEDASFPVNQKEVRISITLK